MSYRSAGGPSRRRILAAIVPLTVGLAGCVGDDDETAVDPADFEDEHLHQLAQATAETSLELDRLDRVFGRIELSLTADEELEWSPPEGMPTPHPDQRPMPTPPEYPALIGAYIEVAQSGDESDGLTVRYDDGRCTGTFTVPRSHVEWHLDDDVSLEIVLNEAREDYRLDCPE